MSFGGAGAIPVSEIRHYCDLVGTHSPKERKRLLKWVQLIDRVWLGVQAENQERKNEAGSGGKGVRKPPKPRRSRQ